MDVLALKYPAPAHVQVGDLALKLRPLSPSQIEQAEVEADRRMGSAAKAPGGRYIANFERRVQVLARASGCDAAQIRALHVKQITDLSVAWEQAQRASGPEDIARLKEWLRRRVNDDADLMLDGSLAYATKGPAEYYGEPLCTLTFGQLAYWRILRAAHEEWHTPDSKGRYPVPTKQWLNSDV